MDPAEQQVTDTGTAGVIARPPLLFLGALLIGFVLDHLLRLPFVVPEAGLAHRVIAGGLILIGIAVFAASIRNFSRAGTPVPGNQPTTSAGDDRHSRVEPQSHLPRHVSRVLRHRHSRAQPVDPDSYAASGNHDPLGRRRARGGVPGAAVRRRLSGLQGPRAPLGVGVGLNAGDPRHHRCRGSSASRRPSPSRLNDSTSRKIDRPGQIAIHGALST